MRVVEDDTGGALRLALRLVWAAAPGPLLVLTVAEITTGLVPVAMIWLTRGILDRVSSGGANAGTVRLAIALGLVTFVLAASRPAARYASAELGRRTSLYASAELFAALSGLRYLSRLESPDFRDRIPLAEQAGRSRIAGGVEGLLYLVQSSITVVGVLATLVVVSPVLASVITAAAVPTLIAQLDLARRRARMAWSLSGAERRELFYAQLIGDLSAAKELRLFGSGPLFRQRMITETRAIQHGERTLDLRELRWQTGLTGLGAALTAGALIWAIGQAAAGALSVGDVGAVIVAVGAAQGALVASVQQVAELSFARQLIGHYAFVLTAGREEPAPPTATVASIEAGAERGIVFDDVWVRYGPDHPWVLCGVDLRIDPGNWVAVVGRNGAGKSTVMKLLCGLYAPSRGTIRWDGIDLTMIDPSELRGRIGAVFQDYVNYDLTAAENIALGTADGHDQLFAKPDEVRQAAELSGADSVIEALPYGESTLLSRIFLPGDEDDPGVVGVLLSGGQWQRLALARALMRRDRQLLVLDEPAAGLDPESESQLQDMLTSAVRGRTRLVISHRLGAVRRADLIVVMDQGAVVASGTHDDLIAEGGLYAAMFDRQRRGYAEDDAEEQVG